MVYSIWYMVHTWALKGLLYFFILGPTYVPYRCLDPLGLTFGRTLNFLVKVVLVVPRWLANGVVVCFNTNPSGYGD